MRVTYIFMSLCVTFAMCAAHKDRQPTRAENENTSGLSSTVSDILAGGLQ
jgi:hypothetical protein